MTSTQHQARTSYTVMVYDKATGKNLGRLGRYPDTPDGYIACVLRKVHAFMYPTRAAATESAARLAASEPDLETKVKPF